MVNKGGWTVSGTGRLMMGLAMGAAVLFGQGQKLGKTERRAPEPKPGVPVKMAQMELEAAALSIAERLVPGPGATVASYGATSPRYLNALLRVLGPEGEVYAVYRRLEVYDDVRQTLAQYGGRVHPIFARYGDAHLDPDSVGLVILLDVAGFYKREPDLHRQAHAALTPGGTLAILRMAPRDQRSRAMSGDLYPQSRPADHRERLMANQDVVLVESSGFKLLDEPQLLRYRTLRVYGRAGDPLPASKPVAQPLVGDEGDGPT